MLPVSPLQRNLQAIVVNSLQPQTPAPGCAHIQTYSRQQAHSRDLVKKSTMSSKKLAGSREPVSPVLRTDSLKNLASRRQNSNVEYKPSKHFYRTEKNIRMGPGDAKIESLCSTSSTMKEIQNIEPGRQKSSYVPSRRHREVPRAPLPQDRKVNGDWFDVIKPIGRGKYGRVYLVRDKNTGFLIALKVIQKKVLSETQLLEQFIRELKIQFYLNHAGIVKLFGFFDDADNFYLLMELGCDGQLYDKISHDSRLSEQSGSFVARGLLQVVDYMHEQKVLHRDIKPENIVLVLGNIKICDFGWAVYNNTEMRSTFCGTPLYFSPELLSGHEYDQKVDLWAIGVMVYELVFGRSPFNLMKPQDLGKIVTHDVEFPQDVKYSQEFRDFISKILEKNPVKRPSAKQLLNLAYITRHADVEVSEQLCRTRPVKQLRKPF